MAEGLPRVLEEGGDADLVDRLLGTQLGRWISLHNRNEDVDERVAKAAAKCVQEELKGL